jgi:hypothetical protein
MITQMLNDQDAKLFFFIGSYLNIYDSDVWSIFDTVKIMGINTIEEYINSL